MARRISYIMPVENISGKWAKTSQTAGGGTKDQAGIVADIPLFISVQRKNEWGFTQYFAIKTRKQSGVISAAQMAQRDRFTAVANQVRTAMATPATLATYKEQWRASGKQVTLRKFIWDAISATIQQS